MNVRMANDDLEQLRRDLISQAQSISAIIIDLRSTKDLFHEMRSGVETERKVRLVEDRHLNERLDRIEERLDSLYKLGMWVLAAFGASLVAAVASFIINGGLTVVPH